MIAPDCSPEVEAIIAYGTSTGVPMKVTSTLRPGAITAAGHRSLHGQGLAVDYAAAHPGWDTDELADIFHVFLPVEKHLAELIYAGPQVSFNIKDGRRVGKYAQHSTTTTFTSASEKVCCWTVSSRRSCPTRSSNRPLNTMERKWPNLSTQCAPPPVACGSSPGTAASGPTAAPLSTARIRVSPKLTGGPPTRSWRSTRETTAGTATC